MTTDRIFYTATMARVHVGQGDFEKAAQIYRYLLERDPGREDLKASLAEVERHLAQRGGKQMEDLFPLIHRWIDLALQYNRLRKLKNLKRCITPEN